MLQVNNTSKTSLQKNIYFVVTIGRWLGDGGSNNEQTSSYKMNTYWVFNVQHAKYNTYMCYIWKVRVIPKSSHHKGNVFSISLIFYLYGKIIQVHQVIMIIIPWIYVSQIIILYILNLVLNVDWKVKVAQSCPTLCDPMDYTVLGILQATILEWVAFPFSMGSSQPTDRTQVSWIAGGFLTSWATREAEEY